MKALKYTYIFVWVFIIPIIIGQSVGDYFLRIYHNYNEHFLAGAVICILSAGIVTWFPMIFIVERADFYAKQELAPFALIGGAGAVLAPIIFGFQNLGLIITLLLIFSAAMTVSILLKAISEYQKDSNYP